MGCVCVSLGKKTVSLTITQHRIIHSSFAYSLLAVYRELPKLLLLNDLRNKDTYRTLFSGLGF